MRKRRIVGAMSAGFRMIREGHSDKEIVRRTGVSSPTALHWRCCHDRVLEGREISTQCAGIILRTCQRRLGEKARSAKSPHQPILSSRAPRWRDVDHLLLWARSVGVTWRTARLAEIVGVDEARRITSRVFGNARTIDPKPEPAADPRTCPTMVSLSPGQTVRVLVDGVEWYADVDDDGDLTLDSPVKDNRKVRIRLSAE